MDDGPQGHWVRPDFFDWGVFKQYGQVVLLTTGLLYLTCFAVCVLLIRRTAERLGYPRAGLVAGLIGLWPMVAAIVQSLDVQQSSMHYQERVHVPALVTIGKTLALVLLLWLAVEALRFRRHTRKSDKT